jgi:tagatose 1,6-diphosphate aldolase
MKNLTIGKIRGLQQISTSGGVFVICAIDHRGSLQATLEKELAKKIGYQEMVQYKLDLCEALAPHASAVLLDPIYGAAQSIAGGILPGSIGLLVSIEATGYQDNPEGRITTLLDGWSVAKIKQMGGSAVKILLYYRPDLPDIAGKQLGTIRSVAEECQKYDLPFLVEPVSYPIGEEKSDLVRFAARKSEMVIETAHQITELSIDVLKAEFPADLHYEKDKSKIVEACQKLTEASSVPWVLLSAGADYEIFREQVKIACRAGASGFLGGRGIWQEVLRLEDRKQRMKYLKTVATGRFKELVEIAVKYATPLYRKFEVNANELAKIPESWYKTY